MKKRRYLFLLYPLLLAAIILVTILWPPSTTLQANNSITSISINIFSNDITTLKITYPDSIKTDRDKLLAIYSLLEQMRLEHNRVGEIARSDWGKYNSNWAAYSKKFTELQNPLLLEKIKLEDILRKAVYTDEDWKALSQTERINASSLIFGDKQLEKSKPTEATSDSLDKLKSIDFYNLKAILTDPYEDWTDGWAETDPNSRLTVAANQIDFTGVPRGDGCRITKDYGADHFGATFTHYFDWNITTQSDTYDSVFLLHYVFVSKTASGYDVPYIGVYLQWGSSSTYTPILESEDSTYRSDYGYCNRSTRYYGILNRANPITFPYYTDAEHTSLVDTLTVAADAGSSLRYIEDASSTYAGTGGSTTGSLYNLDIGEGTPPSIVTNSPTSNTGSAWTNPTYAYDDGGAGYAYITSGIPSGSNAWGTYGFSLGSSNITQVRVRYDAYSAGYSTGATTQDRVPTADGVTSGTFNHTQVRFATANGASSGTWNPSSGSNYQCVDDQTNPYNNGGDTDYMTGQTNASYQTFTFTAFNIPSTATITNVQVIYRARENTTGTTSSGGRLRVAGTGYNSGTNNPGTTYTSYAATWANNPAKASAWTYAEVNGTDPTYPLQEFGIYGTTLATYYQRISICILICNYSTSDAYYYEVDETTPDDGNTFLHTATDSGYKLFTFTAPDLPTGCTIQNVTIYYRAADGWNAATGGNNVRSCLRIEGANYSATDTGSDPGGAFTTYSYSYTTNPASSAAWAEADLEGTGSYDLQQFGHFSSDVAPDVQVSMCYMRINYTPASEYDDQIRVDISWDGGSSWSATQNTTLTSSEVTTWYDVTSVTSWTPTKLNDSNLKVRALAYTVNNAEQVRLDWLPVEVTWSSGEFDISNTPSSKAFGIVAASTTYYAKGSPPNNPVGDGDCTFTITNDGSIAIDIDMKMADFTGGTGWNIVAGAPGSNEVRITAYYSGQNPASGLVLANTDAEFYDGLAVSATKKWDFKLETGTFTDGVAKTGILTITAVAED